MTGKNGVLGLRGLGVVSLGSRVWGLGLDSGVVSCVLHSRFPMELVKDIILPFPEATQYLEFGWSKDRLFYPVSIVYCNPWAGCGYKEFNRKILKIGKIKQVPAEYHRRV